MLQSMGLQGVRDDWATELSYILTSACVICVCAYVLSHVWLCVTLWTVVHQAPLSMGFSR